MPMPVRRPKPARPFPLFLAVAGLFVPFFYLLMVSGVAGLLNPTALRFPWNDLVSVGVAQAGYFALTFFVLRGIRRRLAGWTLAVLLWLALDVFLAVLLAPCADSPCK